MVVNVSVRVVARCDAPEIFRSGVRIAGAISIVDRLDPKRPASLGMSLDTLALSYFDDGINGLREVSALLRSDWHEFTARAKKYADECGWVSVAEVAQILAFGERHAARFRGRGEETDGLVVVHCFAGHSRSPAAAYACFAQALGPGKEHEAVDALAKACDDPHPLPSLLTVAIADRILGRGGAMVRALADKGYT